MCALVAISSESLELMASSGDHQQTAPKFHLLQWGIKPTVPDRRNPAHLHTLTLIYRGPHSARYTALVARRADIYQIPSD
jgi:hypothetical protein